MRTRPNNTAETASATPPKAIARTINITCPISRSELA
jgi:hypothetical protein